MKYLMIRLGAAAALLAAMGIVAFACLATIGHLLAPLATDYRAEIENALTDAIGQPVTIKVVTGRWKGYGPELVLRKVSIHGTTKDSPLLELPEVRISVSLIGSLIRGDLIPRRVTLVAPHLRIVREVSGGLSVAGIHGGQSTSANDTLQLPSHFRITKGKITYEDKSGDAGPIQLSHLTLNIRSTGDRHQLNLATSLSGDKKEELTVAMDLRSPNPGVLKTWNAKFYMAGDTLPLKPVIQQAPDYPHELPHGNAKFQTWGVIESGELNEASGSFAINQLTLNIKDNKTAQPPLEVDRIGGKFRWKSHKKNWVFDLLDLEIAHHSQNFETTRLKLVGNDRQLSFGLEQIALSDITSLLPALLPADHRLIKPLKNISPTGTLENLRLNIDTEQMENWQASGQLRDITSTAWQEIPGIVQLSTQFWASANEAQLNITDENIVLRFSDLFRDPLLLSNMEGLLRWERASNGSWEITTNRLITNTPHIKAVSRLQLKQSEKENSPLFLDLQTDFYDGDSTKTSRYLPVGIMGKEVVDWIDRSIGSGRVPSGSVIVRGPLTDFPYAEKSTGRFEVFFQAENLNLDYWPEWPALKSISANVRFLNNRFDVWVKKAKILDSQVTSAHGQIQDLALTSPFELQGRVEGPLTDNLRLLAESPLKEDFGPITESLDGSNNTRLKIDFAVPIEDKGKQRLKGKLSFLDSRIELKEWQLSLENITGDLDFGLTGIYGKKLVGQLKGSDIQVGVDTPANIPNVTRITAKGNITSTQLQQRFSELPVLNRMTGSSDWTLELDIPHMAAGADTTTRVRAFSDLKGTAIEAPSPLGKTDESELQFELSTAFVEQPEQPYQIRFGSLISANLQVTTAPSGSPELTGVNIALGGKKASSPTKGAIEVSGKLQQLELDSWLAEAGSTTGGSANLLLTKFDVQLAKVHINQSIIKAVSIALQRTPAQWDIDFSSDRANGHATVPSDLENDPIKLVFEKLKIDIDPDSDSPDEPQDSPAESKFDPTEMPAAEVRIKQLTINDHAFGETKLTTRKTPDGIELTSLALESKQLQLGATGHWKNRSPDAQETVLHTKATTPNMGDLLEQLGYSKNLRDAPLELEATLIWPYTPIDFDRKVLNGDASLQLGKGQFLEVDPGLGRVFGLLNLSALQRRLTLDFSDIFAKGFAFDSIEGNFTLDNGDAYTNDFSIAGPAATIDISGRIGLAEKVIDQLITVTPKISSTLPLAGVLAGGPAVGAALLLAQAILGDTLDKATLVKYTAVGPWDNPTLTKLQSEASKSGGIEPDFDITPRPADGKKWQLPSPHNDSQYSLGADDPDPEFEIAPQKTPIPPSPPGTTESDQPASNTATEKKPGGILRFLNKLKPTGPTFKTDDDDSAIPGS